jgi:SulP family sulfate permease
MALQRLSLKNFRGDVFGGLTAAVVALPLALAFGVASGAGAIAGLYGAIAVGLFAALFGGTPAQVSGPTAPMTIVMVTVLTQFTHNPALAFTVVMMAGALQIIFGMLKLGQYVTFISYPVISGFMSGIGCIIIILQLAPLFGHPVSQEGVFSALENLPNVFSAPSIDALSVGLLTLFIAVFLPKQWRKWMPPYLVALLVGTLVTILLFPKIPTIGNIQSGLPEFYLPVIEPTAIPKMLQAALLLAVLGSIDSLLTSVIADQITRSQHDSNQELIGQGIGNLVAGLVGGIPGAGATMRTFVNVHAGGQTPLSGVTHALVLLALVLGFAPLAESIPLAVLAGILLKVGWNIIDWDYLRRLRRARRAGMSIMLTVLLLTVLVDLMTAVGVGIIMASLISARRLSEYQLAHISLISSDTDEEALSVEEKSILKQADGKLLLLHLSGAFSFASANSIFNRLSTIGDTFQVVVIDFSSVKIIDTSVGMAIDRILHRAKENMQQVFISGLGGDTVRELMQMRALEIVPESHIHRKRIDALCHAIRELNTKKL